MAVNVLGAYRRFRAIAFLLRLLEAEFATQIVVAAVIPEPFENPFGP